MLTTLSTELIKNAPWGLWWRICTGSAISIIDIATDVNVILVYWQEPGQEKFGNAIFIMLMLSVLFQLFVIYIQNKKVPRKMLAEALLCVVGLKPGYVRAKRA